MGKMFTKNGEKMKELLDDLHSSTEKAAKLRTFMWSEDFRGLGEESQKLLEKQLRLLSQYNDLLVKRISNDHSLR